MLPRPEFFDAYLLDNIPDSPNIRSDLGKKEELQELGDSLRAGQLQPIGVTPTRLLWGGRRVAAARLVGLTSLKAMVYPELTDTQAVMAAIVENLHRQEMSDLDTYRACHQLEAGGMPRGEIAKAIGKSASRVTTYLSPDEAPPEAREHFLAGRLSFGKIDFIRTSPQPLVTMRSFLGGATLEQVKSEVAAQQEDDASAESGTENADKPGKGGSVKIPLPGGDLILIKGENLTLARIVDLLASTHKAAEKGHEDGLTARSFSSVMRDRAKKPAVPKEKAPRKKAKAAP